MKSMLITIAAMLDDKVVEECQGEIDLITFEITDLTDQAFSYATPDSFEGFSMEIEGTYYPIAVDYIPLSDSVHTTGNEFMLMDSEGIDAITKYANDNPQEVDEVLEDYVDIDDNSFDGNEFY